MPFSIFKNPFEKAKKRRTDDAELVGALLGKEEEAEMREAMGNQPDEKKAEGDDRIRLSEEEEVNKALAEAEVVVERRRKEYKEWAEEFGKDEDWIDATFTFNADGSVEVEGDLDLSRTDVTRFPKGLKSIGGGLDLSRCTGLTSLEGLPASIGEDLHLWDCTGLTSLEGLPASIGRNLYLRECTGIDDIPKGIEIGGEIYLNKSQTKLKANAEAKGYKVSVSK